ncbi:MAG: hypothetical protein HOB40_00475 [Candidatus Marinimicrobia bacterium]|jgi:hypothetical protein|nr:hypothetical protein [Candidatus Neomarinimicrobiota bacterium]MBT3502239.1 hypothetical protein [Candidatus Neomarinimicrobiota bacterium]MBT3838737.1 hypothetical protein [Candidatus Neomarinimicrobiota bacterium]MBT3998648.1 hypothetical protein [Candidatus Neomarinimicrobiota bacterium]MBT4282892.1 hypothetical protein [Candidatus Neomarinimicrobiota bacterium]
MAKKPNAPVEEAAPAVDPQKEYLMDQFGNLMEQVGEGFGGPLQEELIRRLEQTIADFHEEVDEMLSSLKNNSEKRHEKLKQIWDNPDVESESNDTEEVVDDSRGNEEMSDYEKRIEGLESESKKEEPKAKEEKPKKKKGFFGRKKK